MKKSVRYKIKFLDLEPQKSVRYKISIRGELPNPLNNPLTMPPVPVIICVYLMELTNSKIKSKFNRPNRLKLFSLLTSFKHLEFTKS